MPAENETPEWARDAVENPAEDSRFDPYSAFDPESKDTSDVASVVATDAGAPMPTPEEQSYSQAKRLVQAYQSGRQVVDSIDLQPYTLGGGRSRPFKMTDIAQFLFGDEMGAIGMSIDDGEVKFKTETAIQQWSEHPIRTSLALAGWALPGAGKLLKMRRAGKINQIEDVELLKSGKFNSLEEFAAATDETKDMMRKQLYHDNKYQDLLNMAEHDPESMTPMQKVELAFLNSFGHQYSKLSDPSSSVVHNMNHKQRMNAAIQDEVVDPFLKEIPNELMDSDLLGNYLLGNKKIEDFEQDTRAWIRNYETALKEEQALGLEIGMLDAATVEKVGDMYVPLLPKQYERHQRGYQDSILLLRGRRPVEIKTARLESDAFKQRNTGLEEFAEMMDRGEVFGDPKTLTMQGLMEQKMLRMNHEYIRDMAIDSRFSKSAAEIVEEGLDPKKWIDINVIPGGARLRRMIEKTRPDLSGENRFMKLEAFEGLFGSNGMINASGESMKMFESAVRVHKMVKCVTGDMRILTDEGYLKIKDAFEYKEGYLDTSEGASKVWTSNKWEIPSATYHTKKAPILKVTLRDGTVIKGTPEHPLFSKGKEIKLKNLNIGDVIDTYYGGEFPKETVKISWNTWKQEPEGNQKVEIDEDMAELFGWILGDGHVNEHCAKITLGYKDFDWSVERLKALCGRLGLRYALWREKEIREGANGVLSYFQIHNAGFMRLLIHLDLMHENKKVLKVPEVIFRSPKFVVAGFLRGLLDTDGCVMKNGGCTLTSVSYRLSKEVHLLFKWLGIASSMQKEIGDREIKIGKQSRIYKNHTAWRIRFASQGAKKIAIEYQLFGMPRKINRMKDSVLGKTISRNWVNRVVSVENVGNQDVYDVCLEDPHVFICEGMPSHNTSQNPFTHGQNILGNMAFLSQAGFKLFKPGRESAQNWSAMKTSIQNMNVHYKHVSGKIPDEDRIFKSITVNGKTFKHDDILRELDDPWVQDIIEQSSFLAAEGSNGDLLARIVEKSGDVNDTLGKMAASGKGFIDRNKRFYNVEDAGPKFAYYLHNRAKGLSPQAAATEVARRLPIYHGLAAGPKVPVIGGLGPASLRKWMFPWISFPAEAARITKNNMIDYPMRMAAWMHSPQIMQSVVYAGSHAMGLGDKMSYEDYDGIRKGLPIYGNKPGSVVLPMRDKNDQHRAMMLDAIPHLSFYPATLSTQAGIAEVSPVDVAPILTGMLGIMTGKGPFGQPIQATTKADLAGKSIANMIGFFTPPYIQKYFFGLTSPQANSVAGINTYRLQQDLGNVVNPTTMKPGSWLADLVVNNTVMRNYPSSAEQQMHNEQLDKNRTIEKVRGELTRRFNASARSGDADAAGDQLLHVMKTFVKEYGPGPLSKRKYIEWLVRHSKSLARHPQLRNYSQEELRRYLIQNVSKLTENSNLGLEQIIKTIKRELIARQMQP